MAYLHDHTWLGWIIVGALAGMLAKAIVPGRDGGFLISIVLGIVGAYVGGYLINSVLHLGFGASWFGSLIVATIGAVVLLLIYHAVTGRRNAI